MKFSKASLLMALCLSSLGIIFAQTPRRPAAAQQAAVKPAASQPTPAPAPTPGPSKLDLSAPLAVVNGQTVTLGDLDPAIAEEVTQLEQKIAQARVQILDLQINTVLLDIEAKKRKLSSQQLYDLEVTKRVTDPSASEINQFLEANRSQLGDGDPQSIRTQVVAFLRSDREQKLTEEFIRRLRSANPVVMGVYVNSPNLNPSAVVATVSGRSISADLINARMKPIAYKLRLATYQAEKAALDRTVDDILLIAEANKRNIPPENIVRAEITEKIHHASEAEITKYYSENKANINGDLATVRDQIAAFLDQQDQTRLERLLSDRLRKGADIRVLLNQPEQPIQAINTEGEPTRGDANAAVTIVEFTDFECPSCGAMYPVLEEVLKAYGNRVRFVVRNFPLTKHVHARKAAEAADAANAQGKFFEYAAVLFKNQKNLEVASLKKYAGEVGLDRARFDADLDGGAFAAEVKHDIDEGEIYGVEGTPTIFINGVMLGDLTAEALRTAIDRAFAASTKSPK
jgi:protein-disulfide isomerase